MSVEHLEVHWTGADGAVRHVGSLDLLGSAQIQQFSYTSEWLEHGFALGEGLPVRPGPHSPAGGSSTFGVFDDAGPDAWGRRVISRGRPLSEVDTSLGLLAAVADESRQGALRLSTQPDGELLTQGPVAPGQGVRNVASLVEDVQALGRGETGRGLLRRIFLGSTSQGGARPKTALHREDGSLVVAKFPSELDTYDVQTCEAVALGVARDAGLGVPPFELVRLDEDRAVLLTDRFDRTERGRLGYQSMRTAAQLGALESLTYAAAADTARYVAGDTAVRGVVGAAALAICVHNTDDHAKNLGFVGQKGVWRLAPLFDVVPFPDEQTGTPLEPTSAGRSLEQLLDMDWGLARGEVLQLVTRIAQVARGAWDRAPRELGLDAETAAACRLRVEEECDFGTVLDGSEPRFTS